MPGQPMLDLITGRLLGDHRGREPLDKLVDQGIVVEQLSRANST